MKQIHYCLILNNYQQLSINIVLLILVHFICNWLTIYYLNSGNVIDWFCLHGNQQSNFKSKPTSIYMKLKIVQHVCNEHGFLELGLIFCLFTGPPPPSQKKPQQTNKNHWSEFNIFLIQDLLSQSSVNIFLNLFLY